MPRFKIREFSKSLSLDGSSQAVELTGYVIPSSFSIAFWINPATMDTNDRIFDWQDSGPEDGVTITVPASAPNEIQCGIRNGATTEATLNSGVLYKGRWYFIVCTFETNNAKIYTNAVLKQSDTGVTMTTATATPRIGGRAGGGNLMKGLIDDFMIFDRVLTLEEIEDLYYDYKIPSDLDFHLKFDDNLSDSSGNNRTTTAIGSMTYSTDVRFKNRTAIS